MASLKELRNRIGSVKSTQKITKAMQMVAAAKLRRAQDRAESARPYAEKMEGVLANLSDARKGDPTAPLLLRGTGKDDVNLIVVATAERGLCGGFNTSIVRKAKVRIESLLASGKTVKILCVGKKGRDQLKRDYESLIVGTIEFPGVREMGFAHASEISARVLEMFDAGEVDEAYLYYGHFKNVITQEPTEQRIIPATVPEGIETPDLKGAIYDFEPEEDEILKTLLPRYLSVQVLRALLENAASEQGARMTAMDNATRNAGEMIDKLTISYNRTRQAMITKELIEIISGAEAV